MRNQEATIVSNMLKSNTKQTFCTYIEIFMLISEHIKLSQLVLFWNVFYSYRNYKTVHILIFGIRGSLRPTFDYCWLHKHV